MSGGSHGEHKEHRGWHREKEEIKDLDKCGNVQNDHATCFKRHDIPNFIASFSVLISVSSVSSVAVLGRTGQVAL